MKRLMFTVVFVFTGMNLFAIGIGYNNEGIALRHWWNVKTFSEFSVSWEGNPGVKTEEFSEKNYLKYTAAPVYYNMKITENLRYNSGLLFAQTIRQTPDYDIYSREYEVIHRFTDLEVKIPYINGLYAGYRAGYKYAWEVDAAGDIISSGWSVEQGVFAFLFF
ncbi:MAG: hypothetical protein ACLFP1_00480 [Candidatus Goldiibacteriota bacterium]